MQAGKLITARFCVKDMRMLNKMRMLTPGPTPLPEEVRLALAKDMIHHRKGEFKAIMERVQAKLKILFGTDTPVLPLACSGTGAMNAAVYSLFKPGEKVLVVETGKFGERWTEIAQAAQLEILPLPVEWGNAVEPVQVKRALAGNPDLKGVLLQISETSTGVLNPVQEIAGIVSQTDALLICDGISAVGISPCPMREWRIDCLLTGSQKGLMLPPGLALLALSDRAWQKAETVPNRCYYFNLLKERENIEKNQTYFTTPVNLIIGLDASLELLLKKGLDAIYRKQWALTSMIRTGVICMGLELLAKADFAWGVTAVIAPEGIDGKEVLERCQSEFGVALAGGQDRLKGRIVRIGHMGWVDWGDCLAALAALAEALIEQDYPVEKDFLQKAMHMYKAALAAGYPA